MIHKRFEELKHSGALPSPSGVGLAILHQTQRDDFSVEELVKCIQVDPALTGRILKMANSAARSSGLPVTTAQQAAMRLGARGVRNVALSFTLVSSNRSGRCAYFDYDQYWSYSLASAVAAQVIAADHELIDPSDAFTCALLSRIGMLALASVHPETYSDVLREAHGRPASELLRAESSAFHIQHWEVTAAMMAEWGLPSYFQSAVIAQGFANQDLATEEPYAHALNVILRETAVVADALVAELASSESVCGPRWYELFAPGGAPICGIEELQSVSVATGRDWLEWGRLFKIPTAARQGAGTTEAVVVPNTRVDHDYSVLADGDGNVVESYGELEPLPPQEVRLLVVDDDVRIQKLLSHHLKQAGYQVITASNGQEGLNVVLERSPHIVVTDWMMPELNGIELCRAMRKIDAGRKTYILLLTARDDEQQVVDAFNAGADDYVTKPFNPRILLARVQAGRRLIELQRQVENDKRLRLRQVAEMGLMTRKLRAAALTDVLTELPNRRYALMRLEQEWEASKRLARPLSVVAVDIDHFKNINDGFGHDVGDQVLKATADVLRAKTRRGDIVCRLGGEEFLVINVNSDAYGARMCAERLRSSVEANQIEVDGFRGRVTISLGFAERTASIPDVDDLLKAADEAVYAAKAAGRNIVSGRHLRLPESA